MKNIKKHGVLRVSPLPLEKNFLSPSLTHPPNLLPTRFSPVQFWLIPLEGSNIPAWAQNSESWKKIWSIFLSGGEEKQVNMYMAINKNISFKIFRFMFLFLKKRAWSFYISSNSVKLSISFSFKYLMFMK